MALTKTLDPYAPVTLRRLMTAQAGRSGAYSVRLQCEDESDGLEVGVVSDSYTLIPNADVRDLLHEVAARSPYRFDVAKTFFDGKRFALFLSAREDGLVEVEPGDYVGLGLVARNSYAGDSKLTVGTYAERLICRNGMVASERLFPSVTIKHDLKAKGWEDDVAQALRVLQLAPLGLARFATSYRTLASMRLSASRLREIRREVIPELPTTWWGRAMDQLLAKEALDGAGLLNACTAVTWHQEADKMTLSALEHNAYVTRQLIDYAAGDLGQRRN